MDQYLPLGVLLGFGVILGAAFIIISALLGPKRPNAVKLAPYECGLEPASNPRNRFSVHFFLVAILFLLFDVEVTFLFPWAILVKTFKEAGLGMFIFVEGLCFVAVLALGLAYVWKRGALNWQRS